MALCSLVPGAALAQTLTSGAISGGVESEAGAPLGGVTITLTNRADGATVGLLQSSRAGSFAFPFLEPGLYDALFELLGYRPVLVAGIGVGPGESSPLQVTLPQVDASAERVEVERRTASFGAAGTAAQRWLSGPVASLPFETADLGALGVLSSRVGPDLSFEGLPSSANTFVVDGFPRADRRSAVARQASFAVPRLTFLSHADLVGGPVDVEWPASAGGHFTAITRLGGGATSGRIGGDWSGAALAASGAASVQSYRAAAEVGGALGDSARFLLGADLAREEIPLGSVYPVNEGTAALASAVQQLGGDLSPWTEPRALRTDRASLFAAAGMPFGATHDLRAHATFTTQPHVDAVDLRTGAPIAQGSPAESSELFAGGTLASRVSEDAVNELSLAFEWGRLVREAATTLPLTRVVSLGADFGSDDGAASTESVRQLYLRETFQVQQGAHRLKVGGWLSHRSYDLDHDEGRNPRLTFASPAGLGAAAAAYTQQVGTPRPASFTVLQAALYLQDEWVPEPSVRLKAGLRLNVFQFPDTADLRRNAEFLTATGIDNRAIARRAIAFEPRLAATWFPGAGEWRVHGSVTVDGAAPQPGPIAELFSNDGELEERAAVAAAARWPAPPASAVTNGASLTLLGPEFSGARTTRLSGGITRALGSFTLGIDAVYRNTVFLPQRRDLNLLPVAPAEDQYGRPMFGPLEKVGGVLAARPGENHRLGGFSQVWAIEATGTSHYSGITFSLERAAPDGFGLLARYTYSRTEDDWLAGLDPDPQAQLSPFPDGLDGVDWADGRSDFDVPHRLVLGAEVGIPGRFAPRLAALYRRESGAPFTAGFRAGVDVNADGSDRNDPAYIDDAIAGADALLSSWPCLQSDVGGFARRNGCRTDDVQALDARLSVALVGSARFAAHLVVDALDLISSERVAVDRAAYLVDPDRALEPGAGNTTTIPLIANPDFGQPLMRYAPERRIRIGLRLRY
jgi:hypothetical protein